MSDEDNSKFSISKRIRTIFSVIASAAAISTMAAAAFPPSPLLVFLLILVALVLFGVLEYILKGSLMQFIFQFIQARNHNPEALAEWSPSTLEDHDHSVVSEYDPSTLHKYSPRTLEYHNPELLDAFDPRTLEVIQNLGIRGCYSNIIEGEYNPENCLNQVNNEFWFRGTTGSRWFKAEERNTHLEALIKSISPDSRDDSPIKFLILDPRGKAYEALDREPIDDVAEHYKAYEELADEYSNKLTIKLYDYLPQFRLNFIDGNELIVSHYTNPEVLENPCIRVHSDADYTIYRPFKRMFERTWDNDTVEAMYPHDEIINLLESSREKSNSGDEIRLPEELFHVDENGNVYLNSSFINALQEIRNLPGDRNHDASIDILEADIDYDLLE